MKYPRVWGLLLISLIVCQHATAAFSATQRDSMESNSEKHEFQAEVTRLMDIIINSLYKDKEIFLRELISNASDALDKIRFLSVSDPSVLGEGDQKELDIRISTDKEAKTLTITDKGIGMTKEDLINNLGTVAKSGTTNFLESVASGKGDLNLIGQFGVGFYSAFLVADRVTVISKNNNDEQWVWESTADSSFSVSLDPRGNTLGRGTSIVLHLKEDATDYLDAEKIRTVAQKHSEFINFPIYLQVEKTVEKEVPADEEEQAAEEDKSEDVEVEEESEDGEEKKKTKTVKETVKEWELINPNKAIWTRAKEDITDEEYIKFFKAVAKEQTDPLSWSHFSGEGEVGFKSILYIPSKAPYDLFENYYGKMTSLKLYVRRVLITDTFEDLMPRYLNFIRGVVDSDDLPLNVSREQLQQSKVLKAIGKKLVKKALEMIKKLAEEGTKKKAEDEEDEEETEEEEEEQTEEEEKKENDRYNQFFGEFGKNIKLGVIEDQANRSKLAKLLRFHSTKSEGKLISLDAYIARMKENQPAIYYLAGESLEALEKSPLLQQLKKRDYEVLLLSESVDEYTMQHLTEYEGKKLQSISKGELKLGDETEEEKQREKKLKNYFQPLLNWWKELLGDKVEKVQLSNRLTEDPCIIVGSQYGWSANMERIMKAQAFANNQQSSFMAGKKTLEVNPSHPVVKDLLAKVKSGHDDDKARDLANLLFDGALLTSGYTMDDSSDFVARINRVIASGLGVDPSAQPEEPIIPEEEEEEESEEAEDEPKEDL